MVDRCSLLQLLRLCTDTAAYTLAATVVASLRPHSGCDRPLGPAAGEAGPSLRLELEVPPDDPIPRPWRLLRMFADSDSVDEHRAISM